MSEYLFVGGPSAGQVAEVRDGVTVIRVPYSDGMEYVKTRPTDTNWRETYDDDWFIHGLRAAPAVPDKVFEWHERGWQSPEVRMIRDAVQEVSDRLR